MTPEWAAVIVPLLCVIAGAMTAAIKIGYRKGRGDGKLDNVLEQLSMIVKDHEERLRSGGL